MNPAVDLVTKVENITTAVENIDTTVTDLGKQIANLPTKQDYRDFFHTLSEILVRGLNRELPHANRFIVLSPTSFRRSRSTSICVCLKGCDIAVCAAGQITSKAEPLF